MRFSLVLLLFISFNAFTQRVEFSDPDLTFSFVKPSQWMVKDGPTIYVIPEQENGEKAITFFSITYFEGPTQSEPSDFVFDSNDPEPSIPSDLKEFKSGKVGRIYISEQTALWASYYYTQDGVRVKAIAYVFMKFNQRFEITISAPLNDFDDANKKFELIIESLIIQQ